MAAIEDSVRRTLERYRREVEREARVERMVLFGSHVRGTGDEWSDIDVAVVSPDFEDVGKAISVLARARVRVDPAIAPLAFTPKQWDEAGPTSIVAEIKRHGAPV